MVVDGTRGLSVTIGDSSVTSAIFVIWRGLRSTALEAWMEGVFASFIAILRSLWTCFALVIVRVGLRIQGSHKEIPLNYSEDWFMRLSLPIFGNGSGRTYLPSDGTVSQDPEQLPPISFRAQAAAHFH